jgi:hypothetical protein
MIASKLRRHTGMIAAAAFVAALAYSPVTRADNGVKVGVLSCNDAGGWGFVFASTRDLNCTFSPNGGAPYRYTGHISKYGVDIGYVKGGVLVWGVFAPTRNMSPEALNGDYAGVTGGASVGVGINANVLVGGSNKTISLQPLSVEGNEGLNVAAGVASMTLNFQQAAPPAQASPTPK